ncbi:N-formylglutamate amidohydrolase [Roseateles toxinivorans]|uniref:N-formylglutamate amidohydrolase n=1 Tax=Roseateles toxinivorans TaxID=270368 RepID=A0A4R6QJT3_9BURK|nr:N-formylglutamate amidohydrolase [Roseateles toxinivorans]TDP63986.1 N-formylglutamate amidohydrolase [Roseateles toxinivorans]
MRAFELTRPTGPELPIVVDSPHSGRHYPGDFDAGLPLWQLRQGEDAFVEQLWAGAPAAGASLLAANFPRVYIDPNRSLEDIDEALLDAPWPGPVTESTKTRLGIGLVWRQMAEGLPIYERRLSVAEVEQRIARCYQPYHQALNAALDEAHQRFGKRWHLNVHSMPDDSYAQLGLPEQQLADFVLGDLDGSSADATTMLVLEGALRAQGYSVARNDPFKGVEIIRRSGQPARHCHAVQIEIKRSLYMDVQTHQPNAGFVRAKTAIDALLAALARHAQA